MRSALLALRTTGKMAALAFVSAALSACAYAPAGPYWEDQRWNEELFKAVQASVHYPNGADDAEALEATPEPLQAKVQFTFDKDHLEEIEITQSTGRPAMDHALLEQVAAARVPPASGPDAATLRRFELHLAMPTPASEFFAALKAAVRKRARYPTDAMKYGKEGAVDLGFDLVDGVVSDPVVLETSYHDDLDRSALEAVSGIAVPPVPAAYAHRRLRMRIQMCFSLGKYDCPKYKEVIQVINSP